MEEKTTPGIVETLSTGFSTVTRRLWLIAIPAVLDLCYWLGPRLSIAPLVRRVSTLFTIPAGSPPEYAQGFKDLATLIEQASSSYNLLRTLSSTILGIPSIAIADGSNILVVGTPVVIEIQSYYVLAALVVLLGLAGVFIGCVYLKLIAQQVQDERFNVRYLLRRIWVYWFRISLIAVMGVVIATVAALPLSLVLALTAILSQNVASLLIGLFWAILLWVGLYFFFVPKAILLSDAGVWESLWLSFRLVRFNFWPTIGLLILTYVISAGFSLIWDSLPGTFLLDVASVLGNAYIGTGLITAAFFFYRDRYVARLQSPEQTRSTQQE
jgi:hypothetical protein